ncbi:MAG: hypothetical protein Kow0010_24960 [Dehalococcoidia bacterium]
MTTPDFRTVSAGEGVGITYTCGCPCVPTAVPAADGTPGFEHCCCGKVHFAGAGAAAALARYLTERRQKRTHEPEYVTGSTTALLDGRDVEVAWAFPVE